MQIFRRKFNKFCFKLSLPFVLEHVIFRRNQFLTKAMTFFQFSNNFLNFLACDMAGPGFDFFYTEDPKLAAKNVQCIHTSVTAGTKERNCHQNWLMGNCGKSQPAGNDLMGIYCGLTKSCPNETLFNHNVCPYLYNSAFSHDFVANNYYNCSSKRMAKDLPVNFKMGYMEKRKKLVSKIDLHNGGFLFFLQSPIIILELSLFFQSINYWRYSCTHFQVLPIHRRIKLFMFSLCSTSYQKIQ
jgi:hypothetical protein